MRTALALIFVGGIAYAAMLWRDAAYDEGYKAGLNDGWATTCDEIKKFNSRMEHALTEKKIC